MYKNKDEHKYSSVRVWMFYIVTREVRQLELTLMWMWNRERLKETAKKREKEERKRGRGGERRKENKRGDRERERKGQNEETARGRGREGGREIRVPEMRKGCTEKGKILISLSFSIIKILNYLKVCLKIGRIDEENKTVKSS